MDDNILLLASQHQASDYNRAKFGAHGSPIHYLPLSLHLPEQFNELRSRQIALAERQSWWPSRRHQLSLQDEIMSAMTSALVQPHPQQLPSVKTSVTHPINISFIIPPELMALISSHALLTLAPHSPTMLEIPANFTLNRLSILRDARIQQCQQHLSMLPQTFALPPIPSANNHFRTRSNITDALQAAISTGMDSAVVHTPTAELLEPKHAEQPFLTGFVPDTNVSLSLSLKTITAPMILPQPSVSSLHSVLTSMSNNMSGSIPPPSGQPTWATEPIPNLFVQPRHTRSSSLTIGNLYLSSCPGKKVRLDGPVRGRNGVCRDLETDMTRMKQLGVSCIVCCLDDEELEYLGAPWPEYERCAQKTGIDILRLPTPEGLPPLSASHLDGYIVDLINRYSLQGIPILVHCRGGVGRAGVIACCWMIRLGLCGWFDDGIQATASPQSTSSSSSGDANATAKMGLKQSSDTLSFVRGVIALVRRRRSMKAVETYEQVKFLVDYVDYLRDRQTSKLVVEHEACL